jgi:hypothetical protein
VLLVLWIGLLFGLPIGLRVLLLVVLLGELHELLRDIGMFGQRVQHLLWWGMQLLGVFHCLHGRMLDILHGGMFHRLHVWMREDLLWVGVREWVQHQLRPYLLDGYLFFFLCDDLLGGMQHEDVQYLLRDWLRQRVQHEWVQCGVHRRMRQGVHGMLGPLHGSELRRELLGMQEPVLLGDLWGLVHGIGWVQVGLRRELLVGMHGRLRGRVLGRVRGELL